MRRRELNRAEHFHDKHFLVDGVSLNCASQLSMCDNALVAVAPGILRSINVSSPETVANLTSFNRTAH